MSRKNDFLAIRPRKQRCLPDSSSTQRAGPSTWTRHPRICSSTSLPPYSYSSQADLDNDLDDIQTLDSGLDQRSASSATLLSHRVSPSLSTNQLLTDADSASSEFDSPARLSESRQSRFLYPLHEPGHRTAQHTQRLRARTAAIIMSLPATSEEVVDIDEHELRKPVETPPEVQTHKLRRVSGARDLRRAFRDGDHGPVHFASISSLGALKVCIEASGRFDMHSTGHLGFVRARHPYPTTVIPLDPSFFTPYSSGLGECSTEFQRPENTMRVNLQLYIHCYYIFRKSPFYLPFVTAIAYALAH